MGARFVRELSEKAEVTRMTAISDFSVRRTTHLCVYKFLGNKCELNLNESGISCREAVILFVLTRMYRTLIEGFSAVLRVTSHNFHPEVGVKRHFQIYRGLLRISQLCRYDTGNNACGFFNCLFASKTTPFSKCHKNDQGDKQGRSAQKKNKEQ